MSVSRRRFLALTGVGGATVLGAAVYIRGLRYPTLQFEPDEVALRGVAGGLEVRGAGAMVQAIDEVRGTLRAFAPEPTVLVRAAADAQWTVEMSNVHPAATLSAEADAKTVSEHAEGLLRRVRGRGSRRLHWRFPKHDTYRFAVIGDSGGSRELEWVLHRSAELGADFLLHVGDINYQPGDFDSAIAAFEAASIPSFVAIGNHDFQSDGRTVFRHFTRLIGPRNSMFRLGRVQFANLDTAVDSFPPSLGRRGAVVNDLPAPATDPDLDDLVVFTHRPLTDPRPASERGNAHGVNGIGEAAWLRDALVERGAHLLVGHLHDAMEHEDSGLRTYVSGQGMAHADLIHGQPVARILLGEVTPGGPVSYRWEPLKMPWDRHCNARVWRETLQAMGKEDLLRRLRDACP